MEEKMVREEEILKCGCGHIGCSSYRFRWVIGGRFAPDQVPGMIKALQTFQREQKAAKKMAEKWIAKQQRDGRQK